VKIRDEENPWKDLSQEEIISELLRFRRPALGVGEPVRKKVYSNFGYVTLGILLEKLYGRTFPTILATHVLHPLKMTSSGVDLSVPGKRGKRSPRVSQGFSLGADPVSDWNFPSFAAAAGGLESNAVDMEKFVEAIAHPPRGRLGEAIRATLLSGIGWDSAPGNLRPLWKNGMTGGYSAFIAYYPETQSGLFVAVNSAVEVDSLADFALGVSPEDRMISRVVGTRIVTDEEISLLKGTYRNPSPEKAPTLPLRTIEIFESFGRIVARYDFGPFKTGALLGPAERSERWNVIDGSVNEDEIRIINGGIRATVRTASGNRAEFELEKLPSEVQKFPAFEK
jgi:CubicO group peptidase (beta-lactamase class C family)